MDISKLRSVILVVGLTVATTLVVVLALQKRQLLARIEELATRIRDPYVGMYVPSVSLPSVGGDTVLIGQAHPGQVQLLFVFSTGCSYCKASLPAWKQIAREFSDDAGVVVVGISVDSANATREYIAEHELEFPVVSFTGPRLRALFHTVAFPQSIVVDAEGEVQYARLGAVTDGSAIDSIIQMSRSVASMARAVR
jgi:peroxiredoxin